MGQKETKAALVAVKNGRCNDPECSRFGEPLVDRGYGYPVCPSTPPKMIDDLYAECAL